ncbi:helix-turn-helix transcriptional regulator [Couchioplanes azureus]|uniref:helix-turn-helix transcriptional regulator n=1 Tax=Couchioplanes caeruleus TaxID=56438 RepID=UPI00167010B9|nr:helix-turn-helix transcriptional regulator [Couchioplanes caeruleus]GGQ68099.1 transcriptional regulator [Couchioplanes caeruleus subsp. azureus]
MKSDVPARLAELGRFLVARRAETSPDRVGLPVAGRRRTPGLRREEVALLAGVGVSWYTWIEQGRAPNVSGEVLDSIARVLALDDTQRLYMRRLAGLSTEHVDSAYRPDAGALAPFADNWLPNPAYIVDRYWTVVTANSTFRAFWNVAPGEQFNLVEYFFTDPHARMLYPLWEEEARPLVARFRSQVARYPDDPRFAALIGRLSRTSTGFADLWSRQVVADDACGPDLWFHPGAGRAAFQRTSLRFTDRIGLAMVVFLPISGTGTEAVVRRVAGTLGAPELRHTA